MRMLLLKSDAKIQDYNKIKRPLEPAVEIPHRMYKNK
jgi:hypothetical protein